MRFAANVLKCLLFAIDRTASEIRHRCREGCAQKRTGAQIGISGIPPLLFDDRVIVFEARKAELLAKVIEKITISLVLGSQAASATTRFLPERLAR